MVTRSRILAIIVLSVSTYISACAQKDYYYGNNIDSTQQDVVDLKSITVEGVHIGDKLAQAIKVLGTPNSERSGTDEISEYRFKLLYYGSDEKSFFYFYDADRFDYLLEEFELAEPIFSVHIGSNAFEVGDSLDSLQRVYPKSYDDYITSTDPYKSFRLVIFRDGKRMGLEILFVIKEGKIHNISTRYDE